MLFKNKHGDPYFLLHFFKSSRHNYQLDQALENFKYSFYFNGITLSVKPRSKRSNIFANICWAKVFGTFNILAKCLMSLNRASNITQHTLDMLGKNGATQPRPQPCIDSHISPHVKVSKRVADSGFHIVDSGFRGLDSGFRAYRFRIPDFLRFRIPKFLTLAFIRS